MKRALKLPTLTAGEKFRLAEPRDLPAGGEGVGVLGGQGGQCAARALERGKLPREGSGGLQRDLPRAPAAAGKSLQVGEEPEARRGQSSAQTGPGILCVPISQNGKTPLK